MEEWNDIYDAQRRRTGRRPLRGTAWGPEEYLMKSILED